MSADADPAIDAVVPVADVDITPTNIRGLYVATAGNVAVRTSKNNDRTFFNVQAGSVLPIRVRRVLSAGTTSDITQMLALY
jgi:hypothetical protein